MPDREKQDIPETQDLLERVIQHHVRLGETIEKEVERRVREIVAKKTAIKVPGTNLWIELHCEKDAIMRKIFFGAKIEMFTRDGREEPYSTDVQLSFSEYDLQVNPMDSASPERELCSAVAKKITEGMEKALEKEIRSFVYSEFLGRRPA